MTEDAIDAEADLLLEALRQPRRRARPRVARALEAGEHRMVNGVAAWRVGEGSAVLLVHGWEDDTSVWGPLIDALTLRGRAVVALDLPAHGYSEGDALTLDIAAAGVAAVANAFGPIEAAAGHSFGCKAIAFAIAEHGFAPQRVALVASPVAQADQFQRIVERHGVDPAVGARALARMRQRASRPIEEYDLRRLAPAMTVPALFVHSVDDDACPFSDVEDVAAIWPGADLLLVDGLGHRLVAQDAAMVETLCAFLDP
jgi:pimeloyl-ACP methyl ester carboxylesterase